MMRSNEKGNKKTFVQRTKRDGGRKNFDCCETEGFLYGHERRKKALGEIRFAAEIAIEDDR